MNFESNKNLSAIGALLMFIGPLATSFVSAAGILGLLGLILHLVGLKGLADHYKEQGIFNNALYSVLSLVVGVVIAVVAMVAMGTHVLLDTVSNLAGLSAGGAALDFTSIVTDLGGLISTLIVGVAIIYIVSIASAFLFRKAVNQLSEKSGTGILSTAGTLMLVGGVLSIILIGFILIFVSYILLIIGLFQLKEKA